MKKLSLLLMLLVLMCSMTTVNADQDVLVYPFDSITITRAFHFKVTIDQEVSTESYLYGHVVVGEEVDIFVGYLVFENGGANAGESQILIVTNEAGEDLARWVINSTWLQVNGYYYSEYSNHIQIDPNVGVHKDLTIPLKQIGVTYDPDIKDGYMKDNTSMIFNSIDDTYVYEEGLSIVISMNAGA